MIRLVRDMVNKVDVKVMATIDYTGFSATLQVAGVIKSIANLKSNNTRIYFTPSDINAIGDGAEGLLTVFNGNGDSHITIRILFSVVDSEEEAIGYKKISIVLVSMRKHEGSSHSSTEAMIQEKVEAAVASAMTEAIDEKVETAVDGMIDSKVEASVHGIVEEQVEIVVNEVIDTKVEEQVNAIFDDSDSDTIGGQFVRLQESVEDLDPRVELLEEQVTTLEPRVSETERVLATKISLDFEDSDEDMAFFTKIGDEESSIECERDDTIPTAPAS